MEKTISGKYIITGNRAAELILPVLAVRSLTAMAMSMCPDLTGR